MNRRRFAKTIAGAAALTFTGGRLLAAPGAQSRFLLVFLRGGYDAANLLVDRYSLRESLRLGTGFGLHYLTPVGPVNFDLGFKVDPRPGEDAYRFYFSIGMI